MFKRLSPSLVCIVLLCVFTAAKSWARDVIQIVGSSTVYSFSAQVAEHHGWQPMFNTPMVESIGTGGGLKRFCEGLGYRFPDITNASRPIKPEERTVCLENGVEHITQFRFGYDGIVVATSKETQLFELSTRDLFLALAKYVPSNDGSHQVVKNPFQRWREINPSLPDLPIVIYGPPSSSGTQEALRSLVLKNECMRYDWLKALASVNQQRFNSLCEHIREDGRYLSVGENDHISVQRLVQTPAAIGLFGYGVYQLHQAELQAVQVGGYLPATHSISVGRYPLARPLYFYVKTDHLQLVPGLFEYVQRFMSDEMIGQNGLLVSKGLVPLQVQSLTIERAKLEALTVLKAKNRQPYAS